MKERHESERELGHEVADLREELKIRVKTVLEVKSKPEPLGLSAQ